MSEPVTEMIPGEKRYVPITTKNILELEDLSRYAVEENNKKANVFLEFSGIVEVKYQNFKGIIYYLTIEAVQGTDNNLYQATVWVKDGNIKELLDFKPVPYSETTGISTATA